MQNEKLENSIYPNYKMMYLSDLRKERKQWKVRGNVEQVKAIDAELVRRAQDRKLAEKFRMTVFQTGLDGEVIKPANVERPWESVGCCESCWTAKEKECACSCHGIFHGLGNANKEKGDLRCESSRVSSGQPSER